MSVSFSPFFLSQATYLSACLHLCLMFVSFWPFPFLSQPVNLPCLHVWLHVCLFAFLRVCLCVLHVCPHVCLFGLCVCLLVRLPLCPLLGISFLTSACLSVAVRFSFLYFSVCALCVCASVSLCICLSARLSMCVCLSVRLSCLCISDNGHVISYDVDGECWSLEG